MSVITVSYNADGTISKCLRSVANQRFKSYEHIVVDGESTDDTCKILEKHSYATPRFKWLSERDSGIAEAMNKGIGLAKGEWLLFIHSDDWILEQNSLEQLATHLPVEPSILGLPVWFVDGDKRRLILSRNWSLRTRFKIPLCHQGAVIHRCLFAKLGLYNPDFRINMDYDWLLRAYQSSTPMYTSDLVISAMGSGGLSSRTDRASIETRITEEKKAHFENANTPLWKIAYRIYWWIYPSYKKLRYALLSSRTELF